MHDPCFMRGVERAGELRGDCKRVSYPQGSSPDAVRKRVALDAFEDQSRLPRMVLDAINGGNVGVVQGGERACLAIETQNAVAVSCNVR